MTNNFWNSEQPRNQHGQNGHNGHVPPSGPGAGAPRSGNLLRDYLQQQPSPLPPSPFPAQMSPTQGPPPYSPMPHPQQAQLPSSQQQPPQPPQAPQQGAWPEAQSWVTPKGPARIVGQQWIANTVQKVRGWTGRMAAVQPVDQNPLVLYRPPTPPDPVPQPRSRRWKRSRSMRVAMMMKHRRKRWQNARPKTGRIWSSILIGFLLFAIVATSVSSAYAYQYYQSQLPRLQGLANQQVEQTTRIYDRNGLLLYEVYDNQSATGGRRTPVSYQYIPTVMQQAMTSAEDPTFWTNPGIDPRGITRAAIQYVQYHGVVSGGSTITQQLIKNLTGDNQDTLARKIPEAALAIGMTQQYPKWKILEMYFNISPFGSQDLGVEAAAEDYFQLTSQCNSNFDCIPGIYYLNCDAAHEAQCDPAHCAASKYCDPLLGLARASLLAGLPQSPSTYDPTFGFIDQATNQKYYLERQQYVLNQMLLDHIDVPGLGTITQSMVNQAEAMTTRMTFYPYQHVYYHGDQHFVNYVISQLENAMGVQTFLTGGFNIYTTIDTNLEHYVEAAVHRHLYVPEYQPFQGVTVQLASNNNVNDAAVVVMDAKNGEILAMDGSANWNSTNPAVSGNINMAVEPRQPGSSIKPIVYTTAFQEGWYPGMVDPDYKTYFPNGGVSSIQYAYTPNDYGGSWSNTNTTIRVALADSRNIPAIKASLYAGLDNVVNTAQRFGISVPPSAANDTSFALGTSSIPLIQMVGAYQVFANNGTRIPPQYVLDIWDNYGHHLYHFDPNHPGGTQVITPQLAFLMTSVLSDEYARKSEFWPDHELSFWSPPDCWCGQPDPLYPDVAAKTGTTDSFKDNLTIGYTSSAVVGVWAGNANDAPMQTVIGITGAAPIWHSVMTYISGMCDQSFDGIPCGQQDLILKPTKFTPPATGVVQQCVSSTNGLAGSGSCDWMLQGEQPQQSGIVAQNNNNNNNSPTP
jgi:membrane peptidoglycan carboxypeptidase